MRIQIFSIMILLFLTACGGNPNKKTADTLGGAESLSAVSRVAGTMAGAGDCQTALKFYGQILEKDPKNTSARFGAADCQARLGDMAGAVRLYEGLLSDDPKNPIYLEALGKAYLYHGDGMRCSGPFESAAALNGDHSSVLNGLAVCYDLQGHHEKAQDYYKKALTLEPDHLGIQSNLALSYLLTTNKQLGLEMLEKLASSPTATPRDRQNLAFAVGIDGNMERASELYSYDLKPGEIRQNLAYLYQMQRLMRPQTNPADLDL